jgi:hypothetical protein
VLDKLKFTDISNLYELKANLELNYEYENWISDEKL